MARIDTEHVGSWARSPDPLSTALTDEVPSDHRRGRRGSWRPLNGRRRFAAGGRRPLRVGGAPGRLPPRRACRRSARESGRASSGWSSLPRLGSAEPVDGSRSASDGSCGFVRRWRGAVMRSVLLGVSGIRGAHVIRRLRTAIHRTATSIREAEKRPGGRAIERSEHPGPTAQPSLWAAYGRAMDTQFLIVRHTLPAACD